MTDDEILKKASRIIATLEHATAHRTVNELEIMAALRAILTEPELARVVRPGLEYLAAPKDDRSAPAPTGGRK